MELTVDVPAWARHAVSDLTDMHRSPQPLDPERVRRFRIPLPDDVYFEYAFLDAEGRMRADPARPERGDNPWYPEVTAVRGPAYAPHPLASVDPARAEGDTHRVRLDSELLGGARRITVYRPRGVPVDRPLPLVLVQDGTAYQRLGRLPAMLEALHAEGRVRPAALAFLDPEDRDAEYGFGEAFRRFVWREALPRLRDQVALADELHLMGASLGGLASALLALDRPEAVVGLATQSGAFLGEPQAREFYHTDRSWLQDALESRDALPWRVYQEVGTLEWLTEVNRRVAERLASRATEHRYLERSAGHNWTHWRNGAPEALAFLLSS